MVFFYVFKRTLILLLHDIFISYYIFITKPNYILNFYMGIQINNVPTFMVIILPPNYRFTKLYIKFFVWGLKLDRNNVTKIQVKCSYGTFSVQYRFSGFRSWLHLHCIVHTVFILYYIPLQYVCVSQYCVYFILLYFNFLTYFPAVFFHSTLSVIIPYLVKADIALIHAEGSKLIRDRYLELCRIPNLRGLLQRLVNVVRSQSVWMTLQTSSRPKGQPQ